jgi:hypothetical protein
MNNNNGGQMSAEQKKHERLLQELAELCMHMEQEYGFTQEEFAKLTQGWVLGEHGLPIQLGPHEVFNLLAVVARAIKFGIVTRPPKIIM